MSERKPREKLTPLVAVAIIFFLVVLPMLYLASVGPLICIVEGSAVNAEGPLAALASVYLMPAGLLVETGYGEWLITYIDWWD